MVASLRPDERGRLNDLYDEIIADYGEHPSASMSPAIAREAHSLLNRAASSGDTEAERVLSWLVYVGLVRDARDYLKTREQGAVEYRNGAVRLRRLPARYGLRITEDDGLVITKGNQLLLWWEMKWTQFARMVRDLRKQRDTLDERIEVFTRVVLPLRAQYPDSVTPQEACERAGLDPQHLIIDQHESAV